MNRVSQGQNRITIPIAVVSGKMVHCKVTNRQTLVTEARKLHDNPANQTFCFACGRSSDDFRCKK